MSDPFVTKRWWFLFRNSQKESLFSVGRNFISLRKNIRNNLTKNLCVALPNDDSHCQWTTYVLLRNSYWLAKITGIISEISTAAEIFVCNVSSEFSSFYSRNDKNQISRRKGFFRGIYFFARKQKMQKRRKDFKSERRENSIAGKKYGIISFTLTLVIFLVHLIFGELLLGPVSLRTHLLVTWLVSFSLYLSHTTHTHTLLSNVQTHALWWCSHAHSHTHPHAHLAHSA